MSAAGPAAVAGRQAGRHILVTGAGSGIGRAMALRLAAEGAQLSLLGRRIETLEAVAAEAQGPAPRCFACDVREESSTMDAVARAVAASGPLHAAVANAGIGGPNEPGTGDRFADLVQTNLFGVYHTLRAAQAHLAGPEAGRRDLVATASILARIGVPGYSGYCASKAAVTGLVRALAAELAPAGIQVNAIAPGWVETEMAWQGIRGMAEGMGQRRPGPCDRHAGRAERPHGQTRGGRRPARLVAQRRRRWRDRADARHERRRVHAVGARRPARPVPKQSRHCRRGARRVGPPPHAPRRRPNSSKRLELAGPRAFPQNATRRPFPPRARFPGFGATRPPRPVPRGIRALSRGSLGRSCELPCSPVILVPNPRPGRPGTRGRWSWLCSTSACTSKCSPRAASPA
ncbi:MAG: SDR family oxidoreductase [Planctomycetota bacterium]